MALVLILFKLRGLLFIGLAFIVILIVSANILLIRKADLSILYYRRETLAPQIIDTDYYAYLQLNSSYYLHWIPFGSYVAIPNFYSYFYLDLYFYIFYA